MACRQANNDPRKSNEERGRQVAHDFVSESRSTRLGCDVYDAPIRAVAAISDRERTPRAGLRLTD